MDDILTQLETREESKKLDPCLVVLMNDDYTPMNFVVHVLELFFSQDRISATRIMLDVHTKGRAVCGTFPKETATTKVAEVNQYSRENDHPLMCIMEEA